MKPIKLEMQAFGPYLNKTVIDFTPLYSNGLFIITGPTGCGKTTILDAMSFALYGEASGALRSAVDMRSVAAPDELDTEVLFEMSHGSKKYKFERKIKIKKTKKRTGEIVSSNENESNCSLFDNGSWHLLCDGTDVAKKAIEILKFTHDEFSQVVVLPQGEFRRLLVASSTEKQAILQQLFGTVRWQNFTNLLASKTKELKVELAKCREKTDILCKGVDCEKAEEVAELLKITAKNLAEAEEKYKAFSEKFNLTDKLLKAAEADEARFLQLDAVTKKLLTLEATKDENEKNKKTLSSAEKALAVLPFSDDYERQKNDLLKAENDVKAYNITVTAAIKEKEAADIKLAALPELEEKLRNLSENITKLGVIADSAKALIKEKSELSNKESALKKVTCDCEKAAEKTKTLTDEPQTLKKRISELYESAVAALPKLLTENTALETAVKNFDTLTECQKKLDEAAKVFTTAADDYRVTVKNFDNESKILDELKKRFDSDSVYKISQSLHEGCACPVCGSLTHPNPARAVTDAPTKEDLDTQQKLVDKIKAELDEKNAQGHAARATKNNMTENFNKAKAECDKCGLSADEAKTKLAEKSVQLKAARQGADEHKELTLTVTLKEAELQKLLSGSKELEDSKNRLAQEVSGLSGKVSELEKSVPEELRKDGAVSKKITLLKAKADELDKEIKSVRERKQNADTALAKAKERLTAANESLTSVKEKCDKAAQRLREKLSQNGFAVTDDLKAIALTAKERDGLDAKIKTYENDFDFAKKRFDELSKELDGVARPKTAELKAARDSAHKELQDEISNKTAFAEKLKNLDSVNKELDETAKNEAEFNKQFELIDGIFILVNGSNSLKTPIHQFVLGLMLEDIVRNANAHLAKLSSGRYSLCKSSLPIRGNGSKGLDLSVDDAWSGGERPVNTLSGGEMFLASLSLAFGLSDVVQAYSGGTRLDSLFIDEGFGSLDTETLETSMNALESLRKAGRLVGVISHVSELGDRIKDRIVVSRNKDNCAVAKVETA